MPTQTVTILLSVKDRKAHGDYVTNDDLAKIRIELRAIDDLIVNNFAARHALLLRLSAVKRSLGLPISDPGREEVNRSCNLTIANGRLPEEFVNALSAFIAQWGRKGQEEHQP